MDNPTFELGRLPGFRRFSQAVDFQKKAFLFNEILD